MTANPSLFSDRRLEAAWLDMQQRLCGMGQKRVQVRALGGDRAGEMRIRRFLHNPRVTPDEMIEAARTHTAALVGGRHVLAIQDTTSLRDDGKDSGHYLHPTIAVDADDGTLLGVVAASFLLRRGKQAAHCNKRAFGDKESARWLEATQEAARLSAAGAACVTTVADRECDLYEAFALRPPTTELLIRCHHNRVLADATRLYAAPTALGELGGSVVHVPAAPGRAERQAKVVLSACPVTLRRPKRNRAAEAARLPAKLSLTYVEAREVNAPPRVKPLHWRLLTTHPVQTLPEAQRIIDFYRRRWSIEQVFRVMKTQGFDIEAVEMQDEAAFENLVATTLIAAVKVMQMVHDRDGTAARPLTDAFDPDDQPVLQAVCTTLEGNTAKQKNPHPPGSLAYATWVCARLGGWTGYYGKPGPIVIHAGLARFNAMLMGYHIARHQPGHA
ncbi:IS4 family transposase [Rhodopila sp.]|uniref:IS4 family transposase n=1 Tax=Rhodopila sp. TaxID=2480087 RepID=UPI003D133331